MRPTGDQEEPQKRSSQQEPEEHQERQKGRQPVEGTAPPESSQEPQPEQQRAETEAPAETHREATPESAPPPVGPDLEYKTFVPASHRLPREVLPETAFITILDQGSTGASMVAPDGARQQLPGRPAYSRRCGVSIDGFPVEDINDLVPWIYAVARYSFSLAAVATLES